MITKIKHFMIIFNGVHPFAVVAKGFILNVVGFLDSPLHYNKFPPKAVSYFKSERMAIYTCIPLGKVFE